MGKSLQPISHYELLQKLNPLIQKINRSKNSGRINTVGREIQTSIREQLDLFDKRLSDLELGLEFNYAATNPIQNSILHYECA